VKCINFHPGLNPSNRGWYPQVFSIINKKPIGVTVHIMGEEIDHGPIIMQEAININPFDTSLDVYNRLIALEKEIISKHLVDIIEERYVTSFPVSDGNYNSIQDFKELCKLDLNQIGTLGQHIDLLRALTHDDFKNGYFKHQNEKIYVRISFSRK